MARIRRQFVGSIVIDGIMTSYIVWAGLLHAVSSARHDHVDERPEMAPFLAHLGHGFIALFGMTGIWMPGLSFSARTLRPTAILTFFGDVIAATLHATSLSSAASECSVYLFLAILLALSSINVYWRSSRELSTFDDDNNNNYAS